MLLPIIPALEIKWLNKTSKQDNPTLVQLNVISPEIILFSNIFLNWLLLELISKVNLQIKNNLEKR